LGLSLHLSGKATPTFLGSLGIIRVVPWTDNGYPHVQEELRLLSFLLHMEWLDMVGT
jgi:hypothetical protein